MILRRLTTALRKQDWFTVVIETLIVVMGVYLGIQLGNWNAARGNQPTSRPSPCAISGRTSGHNCHKGTKSAVSSACCAFTQSGSRRKFPARSSGLLANMMGLFGKGMGNS